MGGGAASSMAAGANAAELDFDSVQRGNPEIQRRAQEVINHCAALGDANPILAIHDVGAGGLSNAFPELVDGAGRGARFDLRKVPLEESGLAPKEIWCNESQERYVMAVAPERAAAVRRDVRARALPVRGRRRRERARALVVGALDPDAVPPPTASGASIDMPMDVLLGKPPKMHRDVRRRTLALAPLDLADVALQVAAFDVLRHPTVASKRFLITIGDRTVGGLSCRDPMVGPWQVPVADCAITLADFRGFARRGDGDGRAHAARRRSMRPLRAGWRSARRSPTCSPRRSRSLASSSAATGWPRAATIRRAPRRRRRALRHGARGRHGALPGARHRRSGRQGQPVDADALARRRRRRRSR